MTKSGRDVRLDLHYLSLNPVTNSFYLGLIVAVLSVTACGLKSERRGIPQEVDAVITSVSDDIAAERYEKIYNESAELWKQDSTLEQSTSMLKSLREKLGKVKNRTLHTATEQENSSGPLKGRAFIVNYQTNFENGEGMESFTLVERDGRWLLARYRVISTALK
jgi:hypothetical protein